MTTLLLSLLWTILGALLSIVLYPVIIPFIEGPIQTFLTKHLGKTARLFIKKKIRLSGEWIQVWVVDENDYFPPENEATIALYQIGKQIYGKVESVKYNYSVRGTVDKDMYLTGIWEDLSDGNNFKGAFQLYIYKYATHMSGKWIGFSEKNIINTNHWYWRRIEEKEYKK